MKDAIETLMQRAELGLGASFSAAEVQTLARAVATQQMTAGELRIGGYRPYDQKGERRATDDYDEDDAVQARLEILRGWLAGYANQWIGTQPRPEAPGVVEHLEALRLKGATEKTVLDAARVMEREKWWLKGDYAPPGLRHFVSRFESYLASHREKEWSAKREAEAKQFSSEDRARHERAREYKPEPVIDTMGSEEVGALAEALVQKLKGGASG